MNATAQNQRRRVASSRTLLLLAVAALYVLLTTSTTSFITPSMAQPQPDVSVAMNSDPATPLDGQTGPGITAELITKNPVNGEKTSFGVRVLKDGMPVAVKDWIVYLNFDEGSPCDAKPRMLDASRASDNVAFVGPIIVTSPEKNAECKVTVHIREEVLSAMFTQTFAFHLQSKEPTAPSVKPDDKDHDDDDDDDDDDGTPSPKSRRHRYTPDDTIVVKPKVSPAVAIAIVVIIVVLVIVCVVGCVCCCLRTRRSSSSPHHYPAGPYDPRTVELSYAGRPPTSNYTTLN